MKTARRHELHHNQLADWLGEKIEEVTPYSRTILAGVIAVLALVAVTFIWNRQSNLKDEAAWNEYFAAVARGREPEFGRDGRRRTVNEDFIEDLTKVATKYAGRPGGNWAQLTLANTQLRIGIEKQFDNREASKGDLEDAAKSFEKAFDASNDPAIREQATLGLARSYEAQGKIIEARENYEKVVKNWPNGIYLTEAKQRIEDLSQKSTKQFYAWFDKQDRKPDIPNQLPDFKFPAGHPPINTPSFKPLDGSFSIPRDTPITGDVPAADDKKPAEEKKAEDKPAEDKKGDEKKPEDKKPEDKKPDEKEPAKEQGDEKAKEPEKK